MIISAGTVKDTRANVEKFVRRNLTGGIDHVVLFLDAPLPDVEEYLDGQPDVTYVRAHGDWWRSVDPGGLNDRQIDNAALISRLVAGFPWAEWMFMLDGDEVARLDRGVLDGLDPEVRVVRLEPLEAVSRLHPDGDPTSFKRRLSQDELQLLHVLGVIAEPKARVYFRGHVTGKPGLRPAPDLALGVHHVVDTVTGEQVEPFTDPTLTLLHYESPSGEEFVRKWKALLSSGADLRQRGNRGPLAGSISALLALDLPEHETAAFLEELYRRCALDDVETLQRLGLLVEVDPDADTRTAARPPADEVAQLRALLDLARDVPKRVFRPKARHPKAPQIIAELQRAARG